MAVTVRLISSATATEEPCRLTANAAKDVGYSWQPRNGLRRLTTDTATMWKATLSTRWTAIGCATSWHRLPAKKTTGNKEKPPHETLDRGTEEAASPALFPGA